MKTLRKPRIFMGICDIAGFMDSLNKGFRKIKVNSDFYDLAYNRFCYSDVKPSAFVRLHQYLSKRELYSTSAASRYVYVLLAFSMRLVLFIKCLFVYDVFIFCSTRTILAFYDLPVLKFFNKKIIFVFLGTDTRPAYISGNIVSQKVIKDGNIKNLNNLESLISDSVTKRKMLGKIEKYADFLINNPPTSLYHSRPIILFSMLGFPFWDGKIKDIKSIENHTDAVRILHAPSNPQIKGSNVIKSIIEKMKSRGCKIEYIELTNRKNREVLEEIAKCDFVIDELYSDLPLGGLGTEAAFLGKPTINGGYYSKFIDNDFPEISIPPSLFCYPDDLEYAIEELIKDSSLRKSIGSKSKEFVCKNWESAAVAEKYMKLIENSFPSDWLFNPSNNRYILGYGQSVSQLKAVVKALIDKYGDYGLFLDDKPDLINAFRNLAEEN